MSLPPQRIRVLIVDDSAFVRKIVRQILERDPGIEVVGAARDGEEALLLTGELKPAVITCDLTMPRIGGVEFVRRQMAIDPVPILLLTASPQDADSVLEALAAGAIDVVQKPTALATQVLLEIQTELTEKVRTAAGTRPSRPMAAQAKGETSTHVAVSEQQPLKRDVVVLGVSTVGPQALRKLMPQFTANFPVPIVFVLHMPVGYTALFAEKLAEICQLKVREAKDADLIAPGLALLAPAGRHLTFKRLASGSVAIQLSITPLGKPHRPSVDVLFQSAAETFGERVLGVVMTGMGDDGKLGAGWIKSAGGTVLTESEASCVIYGMPRSIVEAGLSDGAIPLDEMAQAITLRL